MRGWLSIGMDVAAGDMDVPGLQVDALCAVLCASVVSRYRRVCGNEVLAADPDHATAITACVNLRPISEPDCSLLGGIDRSIGNSALSRPGAGDEVYCSSLVSKNAGTDNVDIATNER